MGAVRLEGIRKSFGAVEVVRGVSLDVLEGEFCVLLGPSGCGKSTLLRMIAGLEDVTAGTVHIGDREVTDLEPNARNVAMVFQSYALYPHMSVRENMGFALRLARRAKPEIERAVASAAEILGLSELLDRFPRELSGGQRQRVAMGRAIVRDPLVFLFDEPLSNLDAKLRVQMRAELSRLHRRLGNTAIYVTHDQVEAMTMADRIVIMRDGRIEQVGAPLDVYDDPANAFVAAFIGAPAINFLDGRIKSRDGQRLALGNGFSIPVQTAADDGRPVRIGIRPEHLAIADTESPTEMVVSLIEPLGREAIVHGQIAASEVSLVMTGRRLPAVGERVPLAIDAAQPLLFDPETGMRLRP